MANEPPPYYFRIRDNGAVVFRVDTDNRQRRIELEQIAVVNIRNGEIKAHGDTDLNDTDNAAISGWMTNRNSLLAAREQRRVADTIEAMNLTAHWAISSASDAELDAATDDLLMAMHDLRTILVRKKANRSSEP